MTGPQLLSGVAQEGFRSCILEKQHQPPNLHGLPGHPISMPRCTCAGAGLTHPQHNDRWTETPQAVQTLYKCTPCPGHSQRDPSFIGCMLSLRS